MTDTEWNQGPFVLLTSPLVKHWVGAAPKGCGPGQNVSNNQAISVCPWVQLGCEESLIYLSKTVCSQTQGLVETLFLPIVKVSPETLSSILRVGNRHMVTTRTNMPYLHPQENSMWFF